MRYYEAHEVEGALINFLLSLNTLNTLRELELRVNIEDSKALARCSNLGTDISAAEQRLLRYIVPLQEQLSRIKTERAGQKKDEEQVPCLDVKNYIFSHDDQITFDDISGQDSAKRQIINSILNPLLYPRLFPLLSKGILFYGAPGTGKTLLAKAFVNEFQLTIQRMKTEQPSTTDIGIFLYTPKGGDLKGKYVGETEKNISKYFRCASERASRCEKGGKRKYISVIFLDEVDSIALSREGDSSGITASAVNTLLQEMDGVQSNPNVVVMAATNYPWRLDEAILRRFDTKIMVSMPTAQDVAQQIKIEIARYIRKVLRAPEKPIQEPDIAVPEAVDDSDEAGKKVCDDYQKYMPVPSPIKIFQKYRDTYFNEFTDDVILRLSQGILSAGKYSGGDIANICKHAFKEIGQEAINGGRFKTVSIEDPLDSNSKVKCPGGSDYSFKLFSRKEGVFDKIFQSDAVPMVAINPREGEQLPTYNVVMANPSEHRGKQYYINVTNASFIDKAAGDKLYSFYKQISSMSSACMGMYVLIDDLGNGEEGNAKDSKKIILSFNLEKEESSGSPREYWFFSEINVKEQSAGRWDRIRSWLSSWFTDSIKEVMNNIDKIYDVVEQKAYNIEDKLQERADALKDILETGIFRPERAFIYHMGIWDPSKLEAMKKYDIPLGEAQEEDSTCEPFPNRLVTFDFKPENFLAATAKGRADSVRPSTTEEKIMQLQTYANGGKVEEKK
jgi:SpoVK/Ycf46/Vps4 family AAA+-type ATPase